MEEYGIQVADSSGNFLDLSQILDNFQQRLGGLGEVERLRVLQRHLQPARRRGDERPLGHGRVGAGEVRQQDAGGGRRLAPGGRHH
jgi:hypothetical protein